MLCPTSNRRFVPYTDIRHLINQVSPSEVAIVLETLRLVS
jgi:hypothetical protein